MFSFDVFLPDLWINLAELLFERNMSQKREHEEEMEGGGVEMEKLHGGIIRLMEWLFGYSAEVGMEIMISQLA